MTKKNYLQKAALVFAVGAMLWGVALSTVRAETRQGDRVTVGAEEVLNEDLFMGGSTMTVDGVVNGDVYVGGQSLAVSGEINGDLLVGAETTRVTGIVGDDIRGAGRTMVIDGATISDGVMFFGEKLHIASGTEIASSIMFFGRELIVDGTVGGSVRGSMQSVTINGQVDGGVYVTAEQVTVDSDALIQRNLEYTSNNDAVISETAVISGEVVREVGTGAGDVWAPNLFFEVWSFIGTFIVGIALLLIFPRPTVALSRRIVAYPLRSLVVGLIAGILAVPAIIITLFTVVGIPLALILLAVFLVSLYAAKIFAAIALGSFILKSINKNSPHTNHYLSLALGLLVLYLLFMLPVAGAVIGILTALFGLGAIVYGLRQARTL